MVGDQTEKQFSAGGIVFQKKGKDFLWLIIKPKRSDQWRLPKGKINSAESSVAAAKREVREETGVEAEVLDKIGEEKYFFTENKHKIFKTVIFYLMKYVKEAENSFEEETEAIKWLKFAQAKKRLAFDKENKLLLKAQLMIKKIKQGEVA